MTISFLFPNGAIPFLLLTEVSARALQFYKRMERKWIKNIHFLSQYLRHLSAFVTPIHAGVWQIWQLKIRTGFRGCNFNSKIIIMSIILPKTPNFNSPNGLFLANF